MGLYITPLAPAQRLLFSWIMSLPARVIAQIVVTYLAIRSHHTLNSFMPSERQTRRVCYRREIL